MAPDLFSSMALKSLARTLPRWAEWGKKASSNTLLRSADYPFPEVTPKFLGSSVQNFRKRSRGGEEAKPTQAFQKWFDKLAEARSTDLLTALEVAEMLLPKKIYQDADAPPDEFLMEIGSLDGLIATAQELAKPVFAIDISQDTSYKGVIAENYQAKIDDVRSRFDEGAEKIIKLTSAL